MKNDERHELRIKANRAELLADRQDRGGVLIQIGFERESGVWWNSIHLPRRHAKRLAALLARATAPTGGGKT